MDTQKKLRKNQGPNKFSHPKPEKDPEMFEEVKESHQGHEEEKKEVPKVEPVRNSQEESESEELSA